MKQIIHSEAGHFDFVMVSEDGELHCTWCDAEPTWRATWSGHRFGDLVCREHGTRLRACGARVVPRHTLSSYAAGRTA